ncbi:hypothetical protein ACFL0F_00250 [Patescibacteria group bacterium]
MHIEYPLHVVPLSAYPPNLDYVQFATKRGFWIFNRGWISIGEIHIREDVIYLWDNSFEKHKSVFNKAIKPIKDSVSVKKGISKASQNYKNSFVFT